MIMMTMTRMTKMMMTMKMWVTVYHCCWRRHS